MKHANLNTYIKELYQKYDIDDLVSDPGNASLKYKLFTPFFNNLYQNKIIYQEKFICLVTLGDIVITPEKFEATAKAILTIRGSDFFDKNLSTGREWKFGAYWEAIRLIDTSLCVNYAHWRIWCDGDTVRMAEYLVLNNQIPEAIKLLH